MASKWEKTYLTEQIARLTWDELLNAICVMSNLLENHEINAWTEQEKEDQHFIDLARNRLIARAVEIHNAKHANAGSQEQS